MSKVNIEPAFDVISGNTLHLMDYFIVHFLLILLNLSFFYSRSYLPGKMEEKNVGFQIFHYYIGFITEKEEESKHK